MLNVRMMARSLPIVVLLALPVVAAQNPARPTFEVTSVKANTANGFEVLDFDAPDGLRILNDPLRVLILMAYEIPNGKLSGGPSALLDRKFDIVAKAARPASFPERMVMLQTLLEDRFKLKIRKEAKEGDVFALVLARGDGRLGPNIRRSSPACVAHAEAREREATPPRMPEECVYVSGRMMGGHGAMMVDLAYSLSTRSGQTVIDRTGLTGRFDYKLSSWSVSGLVMERPVADGAAPAPSIFAMLSEELGLKLERQRGPVESWVIDGVEPPTPD